MRAEPSRGSAEVFWETDPFLKTIFGQDDLTSPALKRPDIPIDITSVPADNVWDYLHRPKRRAAGVSAQR